MSKLFFQYFNCWKPANNWIDLLKTSQFLDWFAENQPMIGLICWNQQMIGLIFWKTSQWLDWFIENQSMIGLICWKPANDWIDLLKTSQWLDWFVENQRMIGLICFFVVNHFRLSPATIWSSFEAREIVLYIFNPLWSLSLTLLSRVFWLLMKSTFTSWKCLWLVSLCFYATVIGVLSEINNLSVDNNHL